MKEMIDNFLWTKQSKVITRDHHHVPGLANFSHRNLKTATSPVEMHYHKNIFELQCMIDGRRIYEISNGQSLETYIVRGNQIVVIFPAQVHGNRDSFIEPYEFYSIQIDISDREHMLGLDKAYSRELCRELDDLKDRLTGAKEQRLEMGSTHISLLRSAFTLFSYMDEEGIRTGVQFLTCFLYSLKYLNVVTDEPKIDEQISTSIRYAQEHFMDDLSLQDLADVSGYSLSYFKAKFKKELGLTPAGFLTMLRLEYAKKKLAGSNCSITKLAADLSFSSASHFCDVFKKQTSYTPGEYRHKYSEEMSG